MAPDSSECDIIVVGGGTAGCTLASRLHELRPELSITVIERGPDAREHPLVTNPLGAPLLPTVGLVNNFETVPQPQLNGRRIRNFTGNMLSGSSGANYGFWMRGSAADYDLWAHYAGDERWSYKGLLPYFRKIEHHFDLNGNREQHGFDGPIYTTTGMVAGVEYPLRKTVLAAFKRLGYEENPDGNDGRAYGIQHSTRNWRDGKRQPAGTVYDLSGVNVLVDTAVHCITMVQQDDGVWKATGVQLVGGRELRARRQVILSAGAHKDPQILMLSGIGPTEELLKHKLNPLIDLPEVGRNLWDHFSFFQRWRLKNPERGLALGSPALAEDPKYLRSTPIDFVVDDRIQAKDIEARLRSDGVQKLPNSTYPDLLPGRLYYNMLIAYAPMGVLRDKDKDSKVDGSLISSIVLNYLPTSRGTITLASSDPESQPVVDPRYYTTERDRFILRTATRRMMEAMETPEMQEVILEEAVAPGMKSVNSKSTDEEIDERIAEEAQVWHHPSGTCALGSVVDGMLKVKGTSNLRVVDTSVFPSPISATTQASVYALAESAADMLAKEL